MFIGLLCVQIISVIVTFFGVVVLMRERPSEEQKLMLSTTVCVFIQSLGYVFEVLSASFGEARLAICMEYVGGAYVSLFYALFMFQYCKVSLPKWIRNLFFAHSTLVLLNVLTAPYSNWYYSNMNFVETGLFPHMELGHGPLYLTNIAVSMVTILTPLVLAVYTWLKKRNEKDGRRIWIFIVAMLIPLATYIAGMAKELYGYYDPVPLGTAVACIIIIIAVLKQGVFDVVGSAHEHILAALEDAFIVVDENYNLWEANESAKRLFPILNSITLGSRAPWQIKKLFEESGTNMEMETEGKYYNIHVQHVYNQEMLIGYAAIFFDITESKRHYNEMKEMKLQADNANQEKSKFLARMSHEIRTPMNAIIGYSELILQEDIGRQVENYALDIKSASNNLLSIINDILDISKIESGKLEIIEGEYYTQSLIYDIMSVILIPARTKKLKLVNDFDTSLPRELYGDGLRIRQIMINILNNAVKFTEKGSITLSLHKESISDGQVSLIWKIADTGKGIREEDMEKIYGQFAQVDKRDNHEIEGTGLGLSISKSLVEAMNGTIEVESEYGKGTTFTVRLKQRIVDPRPIESISIDGLVNEGRIKEKISFIAPLTKALIVDDNQVNLDVLKGYLRHYKIVPDLANSGKEAIEMVQKSQYDLVFMDQMMPEMDGVEATARIRELGFTEDKLVIIALTANAINGTREILLDSGFNDYESKPISIKKLEGLLLKHLPGSYIEYQAVETDRKKERGKKRLSGNRLSIEGIDIEEGLSFCGGSMESYLEILKTVCQYGDEKIQLMEQCIQEKDYERYVIEVHALKSNAATIGAKKISAFAKNQEMAGKEGRLEEIDRKGNVLLLEYREMLNRIQEFLKKEEEEDKKRQKEATDRR